MNNNKSSNSINTLKFNSKFEIANLKTVVVNNSINTNNILAINSDKNIIENTFLKLKCDDLQTNLSNYNNINAIKKLNTGYTIKYNKDNSCIVDNTNIKDFLALYSSRKSSILNNNNYENLKYNQSIKDDNYLLNNNSLSFKELEFVIHYNYLANIKNKNTLNNLDVSIESHCLNKNKYNESNYIKPVINSNGLEYFNNPITKNQIIFCKNVLKNHFLFKQFSTNELSSVVKRFNLVKILKNNCLFNKGNTGHFFYIIYEGEIEIIVESKDNDKTSKFLTEGKSFGELALIQLCQRSASAMSVKNTTLLYIEGSYIKKFLSKLNKEEILEREIFLNSISILSKMQTYYLILLENLLNSQISQLSSKMIKLNNTKDDTIVYEDCMVESLYIIKEGIFSVINKDKSIDKKIYPGDFFGELSLIFNIKSTCSIVAYSITTVCYQMPKSLILNVIGEEFKNIILKSFLNEAFAKSYLFQSQFVSEYIDLIFKAFDYKFLKKSQIIELKEEPTDGVIAISIAGAFSVVRIINLLIIIK